MPRKSKPRRGPEDDDMVDRVMAQVEANVERVGWHVTAIFPTHESRLPVAWCYTTGLFATYQQPEVVCFALPFEVAHHLLADLVQLVQVGLRLEDGLVLDQLIKTWPVVFKAVGTRDDEYPLSVSNRYYARRAPDGYPALQMVLPDVHGRFPWDAGVEDTMRLTQTQLSQTWRPMKGAN